MFLNLGLLIEETVFFIDLIVGLLNCLVLAFSRTRCDSWGLLFRDPTLLLLLELLIIDLIRGKPGSPLGNTDICLSSFPRSFDSFYIALKL